jgi:sulfur-carrier protein adenylyltransferase/sulfurtransferase
MRKIYANHQLISNLNKLKKWSLLLGIFLLSLTLEFDLSLNLTPKTKIFDNSAQAVQVSQINVEQLKNLIDDQIHDFIIVDVRTPEEYQIARISDAINIPLADIQNGVGINQIKSLAKDQKLVLYCSAGVRSTKALHLLNQAGVSGINLQGGIREWRAKIEPTMPKS